MEKAPDAFRTISEVADEIDVPQHVLRFWESRFSQIRPMKRGGGRRYYRPDDVDLLRGIRHLLYGEGYTIRGVQRILGDEGVAFVQDVWREGAVVPEQVDDDHLEAEVSEKIAEEPASRSPSLFAFAKPVEREAERREPVIAPPASAASPASSELTVERGLASDVQAKLRSVLDELAECRRLIEASLVENGPQ